ncbi:MAG: hypothetical protein HYY96_01140 [Candidatus Tectomicrobia bacterium]|nr:hypothetical protein [Candidatus Tectomicrobia bacterium]
MLIETPPAGTVGCAHCGEGSTERTFALLDILPLCLDHFRLLQEWNCHGCEHYASWKYCSHHLGLYGM